MSTKCRTPFYAKKAAAIVPCGRCLYCKKRLASGWSVRISNESRGYPYSYFITLTYSNETVPITPKGFLSLRKADIQKWFKRLRYEIRARPADFKYYAIGEYGSQTKRPHYHAIVLSLRPITPDNLLKSWTLGATHVGTVTEASIGYCLKYISKKKTVPLHKNDDREKEKSMSSKGIGMRYVRTHKSWHLDSLLDRYYSPLYDGKKAPLSRYLKNKIYDENQRKLLSENFTPTEPELRTLAEQHNHDEAVKNAARKMAKNSNQITKI